MDISPSLQTKYSLLRDNVAGMGSALVAYSGGVDSTFLLKTAHELLGDGVLAVTSRSPLHPEREQREAYDFCAAEKIPLIYCETDELALDGFAANSPNRCYLCRVCQFTQMWELANARGIRYVIEGTGADADSEHRHGFRVVAEKGVRSPLREAGLTKADVRVLARHIDLPDWDKPSYSCLATRFPYGESVTREKLRMVDFAEQLLINLGFHQARVSIHGDIARIQLDTASFERFTESNVRDTIACALQGFGFTNVTLDLKEWRPPI